MPALRLRRRLLEGFRLRRQLRLPAPRPGQGAGVPVRCRFTRHGLRQSGCAVVQRWVEERRRDRSRLRRLVRQAMSHGPVVRCREGLSEHGLPRRLYARDVRRHGEERQRVGHGLRRPVPALPEWSHLHSSERLRVQRVSERVPSRSLAARWHAARPACEYERGSLHEQPVASAQSRRLVWVRRACPRGRAIRREGVGATVRGQLRSDERAGYSPWNTGHEHRGHVRQDALYSRRDSQWSER